MIRGAIEFVSKDIVQGWLFCSAVSLRNKTVLAFVGARCVGAGKIDVFRPDLKEAGLGDGYGGFEMAIALSSPQEAESLVVRLENSDLSLLQKDSRVHLATAQAAHLRVMA